MEYGTILTDIDNLYLLSFQKAEHGSQVFKILCFDSGVAVVLADFARVSDAIDQLN